MFGPFRPTSSLSGGLLWKRPWRLSSNQKYRQRKRLQRVDGIIATLDNALKRDAATYQSEQDVAKSPSASTASAHTHSQEDRRHGKGPKDGDLVPEMRSASTLLDEPPRVKRTTETLLAEQARAQGTFKRLELWKAEMPTEAEMLAKNKYTMFDRKEKGYRKGIHKLPKWTRLSQRLNPPGY